MVAIQLEAGQWNILRTAYDMYLSYISPFVRCTLEEYFKRHTDDYIVESTEELDALISLCEVYKRRDIDADKGESIEKNDVKHLNSILDADFYIKLIRLLDVLTEQREQYRLTQSKGYSRFVRQV